jgi:two-component system C4-dicarboxylate transport response regulator DctD
MPFVAINCGGLRDHLFESKMFGYEAGAFTEAYRQRGGKIEYAHGGTLFLDEIECMPSRCR